ncbi:Immunoglobulin-like domain, partial [Trinorchestia longiramus]
IAAPRARVVDERGADVAEKHYNSGSLIQLKCYVDRVPFPPGKLVWRKASTVLTFNTSVGGISVKADPVTGLVTSRLYVANAAPSDSGVYSCWYEEYVHDNVTVHVIAGEYPAAMQHDSLPDS